jgi:hypothetical protein
MNGVKRPAWLVLLALVPQDSRPASQGTPLPVAELVKTLAALQGARREQGACLRAAVTQTTRVPQLAQPVVSRGTMWFAPPDRFRLEIHEPRPSCVVLDRGSIAAFRGTDTAPQAAGAGGVVSAELTELIRLAQEPGRLETLAAHRDVTGSIQGDLIEIRIQPREREATLFQRYRGFHLRIARQSGDPVSLALVGREQDSTEYVLEGVTWHKQLPADLFRTDRWEPAPAGGASRPASRGR